MPDRNPDTATIPKIGVYVCHCGANIASIVDVPGVAAAREFKYMCSDPGQELIRQDIKEHNLNRIVVASCSPLMHEPTFRGALARAGINAFLLQMVNIREQVSRVHTNKEEATTKAKDLVRAAVRRVRLHKPLEKRRVEISLSVLVVGGGIAKFVELEPYIAHVTEPACSGCKTCLTICPYTAISFVEETESPHQ